MNRQEVLDFVQRNPVSHMATLEDGRPRVRAMHTALVDGSGLTFCTGTPKPVCAQLLADPSVELSYWDQESGIQIRIRGEMEQLDDLELKARIVGEIFTFLQPVVEQHGYDILTLFRLPKGESRVWRSAEAARPVPEIDTF